MGQNEDCSPGDSISDSSEKLLQGGKGGARIYRRFCTKGQIVRNIKILLLIKETRYVKLRNLALFYVWEDARVWAH